MNCRACGNPITDDAPLFVLESRTQFELLDGWRLPFHLACCSEVCRSAVDRRERETLAVYVPIVDAELYPDAFQRKEGHGSYVPPAESVTKGNRSKNGFPEPRRKWDERKTPLDWLNEGRNE